MKAINSSVRPAYHVRYYGDLCAVYSAATRSSEKRYSHKTERARLRAALHRELLDEAVEQIELHQMRVRARGEAALRAARRSYERAHAAASEQIRFRQWASEQCLPVMAAERTGVVVNGICIASCDASY